MCMVSLALLPNHSVFVKTLLNRYNTHNISVFYQQLPAVRVFCFLFYICFLCMFLRVWIMHLFRVQSIFLFFLPCYPCLLSLAMFEVCSRHKTRVSEVTRKLWNSPILILIAYMNFLNVLWGPQVHHDMRAQRYTHIYSYSDS